MADGPVRRIYAFDSSSLIELSLGMSRLFPIAGVWDRLAEMVAAGRIRLPQEALNEIRDEDLGAWVRRQAGMVVPTADVIAVAMDVVRETGLCDTEKARTDADPFVVALAEVVRETAEAPLLEDVEVVVVTQEVAKPGKLNIPSVCEERGVSTVTLSGFFELEGITASLSPPP